MRQHLLLFLALGISNLFVTNIISQTEFKKDSIHLFQWDNSINDWKHNTREYLTYENGGTKETNLLREVLSGSEWVNFYQFNKTYNDFNNILENTRQNWNGSTWSNTAKYNHEYDSNQNETTYQYLLYYNNAWQNYQRELKSYVSNHLNIKTLEQYDATLMQFTPEDQYQYTYAGNQLDYEIKRIYFPSVSAWENDDKIEYTYNTLNQLTDTEHFGFNSNTGEFTETPYLKTHYTYTTEGFIEETVTQIWATSQFVNTERFLFVYTDGNQTELVLQNWSSASNTWINTYRHTKVYDTDNNEIEFIYENWDTSSNDWKGFLRILSFWSLEETLSTEQLQITNLQIYPNPSSDYITIKSETVFNTAELFDLNGKHILKSHDTSTIKVSHLNSGMYLLKLHSENKTTTKKIIIK